MTTNARRNALRHYGTLLLGVAILAFGLYNVHSRTAITEGGVLGMTLLIQHWFHITPGISGLILDITCYIFGFRLLGKAFLKNALVASVGFSACYNIYEWFGYVLPDLSPYPLAACLLGGLFVGVGVGLVVREGGASGGDDALALIIAKVSGCRIAIAYLATDLTVLLLSLSYIPWQRIAYSLITVTLSSFLIDKIQTFRVSRRETA
ncbi:YitT family protein [Candidatus Avoscillospira sp. LCP25S3_F1]|uniref:YitT family protein n=1 Tax=Candidatus Avoscillospira sp. LCP25S3_F1 TaxID=3438825 RepID=UPI003F9169AF